jgi:molecular chaperone GrpE
VSQSGKIDLNAQISQKAIDEALKAVEGTASPEAKVDPPTDATSKDAPAADLPDIDKLKSELEKAKQGLKERDAILEMSQQRSRETMERLKDTHDRMLRALADLDNYKKRAAKEKEETIRFGNERLLKEVLPVIDNLDRALLHASTSKDFETLLKGVELTRKSFEDVLMKKGVKAFSALGKPFDPTVHEALQQVETADAPPNMVVQEVMRGFFLNDRLMRPAAVVVSRAPAPKAAAETPAAEAVPAAAEPAATSEKAEPTADGPVPGTPGKT